MFCFYVIDLASEYENEQGLELFCGTCLVESCALLSRGQTSGFFRPEAHAEPWPALLWGCIAGAAMGVVPCALLLSAEPASAAGSPPSFLKKAVAKQHEFKGRSNFYYRILYIYIYVYYLLIIITFI